jgi:Cell cycle and development regulator
MWTELERLVTAHSEQSVKHHAVLECLMEVRQVRVGCWFFLFSFVTGTGTFLVIFSLSLPPFAGGGGVKSNLSTHRPDCVPYSFVYLFTL